MSNRSLNELKAERVYDLLNIKSKGNLKYTNY